jgi:hypothetical protein
VDGVGWEFCAGAVFGSFSADFCDFIAFLAQNYAFRLNFLRQRSSTCYF